ncbi:MAG: hypothetical protein NTX59_09460 [Elusimicrobia bacterium]|nr:hypothetical protein [Elusimicrobiota bacterium]
MFPTFHKYRREIELLAAFAAALAFILWYGVKEWNPRAFKVRNAPAAVTGFRSHTDSIRLLKEIYLLNVLKLPDQWYFAKTSASGGLKEHFAATAALMREKNPAAPDAAKLISSYYNGGKPFMDPVWFNHPIIGGDGVGAGEITVVSVSAGLTVRVDMEDIHAIEKHNGSFTADQSDALKRILGEFSADAKAKPGTPASRLQNKTRRQK